MARNWTFRSRRQFSPAPDQVAAITSKFRRKREPLPTLAMCTWVPSEANDGRDGVRHASLDANARMRRVLIGPRQ